MLCLGIGSYGSSNRSSNGNSLLDDLDSFVVEPLRPGPPVIKNFYSESPLITNRSQVNTQWHLPLNYELSLSHFLHSIAYHRSILSTK